MLRPQSLALNAEIQSVKAILRRTLGAQIPLVLRLDPELGLVRADPGQLSQVLINLTLNARDAMPHGGTLTIETAAATLDGDAVGAHLGEAVLPGRYGVITVSDTGHGMDRETLSRIFELVFTTKPVGEGTGLGLLTVHGIVRQSGGYIWVDSSPGRGTTFRVYLPRAAPASGAEPTAPAAESATSPATGTILVVEDEPIVRQLTVRALREAGYVVLETGTGREALELAARDGERLDLVITDLVMPEMGGGELAERLAELRPDLTVLITSGHTAEEARRRGLMDPAQPFLRKPYSPEELTARVRQFFESWMS